MKKPKKIVAVALTMIMAAGLAVTRCSGRGRNNGTDGASAEQSKEIGGRDTNSSKDDAAKADDGMLHLTFYYSVNVDDSAAQLIKKICADSNAESPDIFVEPVYAGNYDGTATKTQTTMQGGTPPDMLISLATQRFTVASTGMAMPPGEPIEADGEEGGAYIGDFFPGFMEDSYVSGKIYPIPLQKNTMVLYCSKDAFREVDLDPETPPATWKELAEYGQKLMDDGCYGVGIVLSSDPAQWAFTGFCLQDSTGGQSLMSEGGKSVYFNTPESVEVLQFWLNLQNEYECMAEGIVQWIGLPAQFFAGEVAMTYHTTDNMANIHDSADFDFGAAFLPIRKRVGTPTGGGNFYISSGISGDRMQAIWKSIKFTTSTDGAVQWSLDIGYVAIRQSCLGTNLVKGHYIETPQASAAHEQLPYARPELITYNVAEIQRMLSNNIQAAAVGGMSAREALDTAQEQAGEIPSEHQ